MTVKELIAILANADPDSVVRIDEDSQSAPLARAVFVESQGEVCIASEHTLYVHSNDVEVTA